MMRGARYAPMILGISGFLGLLFLVDSSTQNEISSKKIQSIRTPADSSGAQAPRKANLPFDLSIKEHSSQEAGDLVMIELSGSISTKNSLSQMSFEWILPSSAKLISGSLISEVPFLQAYETWDSRITISVPASEIPEVVRFHAYHLEEQAKIGSIAQYWLLPHDESRNNHHLTENIEPLTSERAPLKEENQRIKIMQ